MSVRSMERLDPIRRTLDRLLGRNGLELRARRRTLAELKSCPLLPTSGWILDMIGTRGVGKSTLTNAVSRRLKGRWFFRHDLPQTGPSPSPGPSLGPNLGPTSARSHDIERVHRQMYFRKIGRIENAEPDPWKSITMSRQAAVVISESLTLMSHVFPRGFLLNDSLFKNFPDEVLELDSDEAAPLWRNRAFVHLRARDPELVVSRFQGRVAEREKRGSLQHIQTDADVRARVEADNRLYDRMIEMAPSFGCPSITVHAEDGLESAIRDILAFEGSLGLDMAGSVPRSRFSSVGSRA